MINCLDDYKIEFFNFRSEEISDKDYFAINALSTSKLKLIDETRGGSWEKYKAGFGNTLNFMILGSAIHNKVLSPDEYIISDYTTECTAKLKYFIECLAEFRKIPKTKKDAIKLASEKADYYKGKLSNKVLKNAYEKGRDYYKKLYLGEFLPENNDGKIVTVLDTEMYNTYKECVTNLTNDFNFKKLFYIDPFGKGKDIINERAFFCDIKVTFPDGKSGIIPFKGKADNIIIDHDNKVIYLNDIKTTSKSLKQFLSYEANNVLYSGVIEHHFYYGQLFLYLVLLQGYLKSIEKYLDYSFKCCILAVETSLDHNASVIPISNSYILQGAKEAKRLICELANNLRNE